MSLVRTEPRPTGRANGYGVRDVVTEARSWRDTVDFGSIRRGVYRSMGIREVPSQHANPPLLSGNLADLADIEEQSGIDTHCATGWHAKLPHGTGYVVQLHRIDPHERGAMHLLGHGMGDTMRQAVEHALVDMDRSVERGGDWVEVHALLWAARARLWAFEGELKRAYPAGLRDLLYTPSPMSPGAVTGRYGGDYRVRHPDGERTVTMSTRADA